MNAVMTQDSLTVNNKANDVKYANFYIVSKSVEQHIFFAPKGRRTRLMKLLSYMIYVLLVNNGDLSTVFNLSLQFSKRYC